MPKQLRIAVLGDFQKYYSWYLAGITQGTILNGHLFYGISIRQAPARIEEQINFFKPNILFCHMIFSENLLDANGTPYKREQLHETLTKSRRKWSMKICYQEGDAKGNPRFPYLAQELIDLGLINSQLTDKYSNILGVPCVHFPYYSLYQKEIDIADNMFKTQLTFAGNTSIRNSEHLHYGRFEFIERLKDKFSMKIYPDKNIGNSKFCTNQISASSSAVLGIHQGHSIPGYLDTRPWMYCGSGALYFHDNAPSMDLFFEEGIHYVKYKRFDAEDIYEKYMHYMSDDRETGNKIRKEAFRYCQAYHTSKHRVQAVIDILDGRVNRIPLLYLNQIKEDGYVPE